MCLAIPAKIIEVMDNQIAIVNVGGVSKEISTVLINAPKVGDFVIIHVGFALTKLDEAEARKNLALFKEMLS